MTLIRRLISAMSAPRIRLDAKEAIFVQHLDRFAKAQTPPVECRIAGGWVRDKLLSLPSSDLDIALSISSAYTFACQFVDHLKAAEIATGSVGKVAANPDQSKHLETGTTTVMGLECDFVGLRSETYTDSRIPAEVRLGTPLEDAQRRDLTINALFYNVHTQEVEDWTGHGLNDLQNRVARTPLPPRQTFLDDPLRVVRCVRFASRFSLSVEENIVRAIGEEDIKGALRTKVSKERIGIEVTKIMSKNPLRGLTLIDNLGLHSSIFTCTEDPPRQDALRAGSVLSEVGKRLEGFDEILWLCAAVYPFRDITLARKKPVPAVSVVVGEGLKLSNDIRDGVTRLFAGANMMRSGIEEQSRSKIGLMLRDANVRPWRRTLRWAAVMELMPFWNGSWDEQVESLLAKYLKFIQRVDELGLEAEIDRPPLLDGKAIQALIDVKPGPILQIIIEAVVSWQLANPTIGRVECEGWLREAWSGPKRSEWEAAAAARKRK